MGLASAVPFSPDAASRERRAYREVSYLYIGGSGECFVMDIYKYIVILYVFFEAERCPDGLLLFIFSAAQLLFDQLNFQCYILMNDHFILFYSIQVKEG